jgi:hypothetical protein
MRASVLVARSNKDVGNQQFFSDKAVFAFLFLGFGRLTCLAEKRTRGATPKEYKSLPELTFAKALLQLLIKLLLFLRHFR